MNFKSESNNLLIKTTILTRDRRVFNKLFNYNKNGDICGQLEDTIRKSQRLS